MTSKEFEILEFLARNQGQVFSKEQIYNRIWGEYYVAGDCKFRPNGTLVLKSSVRPFRYIGTMFPSFPGHCLSLVDIRSDLTRQGFASAMFTCP